MPEGTCLHCGGPLMFGVDNVNSHANRHACVTRLRSDLGESRDRVRALEAEVARLRETAIFGAAALRSAACALFSAGKADEDDTNRTLDIADALFLAGEKR
jgi:hypothetical protein